MSVVPFRPGYRLAVGGQLPLSHAAASIEQGDGLASNLGRPYRRLWLAYAISSYGTWLGFGAFAFLAIRVLHAGSAEVAAISAAGLVVGALAALPLGPWAEFRRKRPVLIAMDLVRFAAQASIPVGYALGLLSIVQLVCVSIVLSGATIVFTAASGAYLKAVVEPADLLAANARFESTNWSASMVGPALGGAAIGLLGPVATIAADAVSYLLSALSITSIGPGESPVAPRTGAVSRLDLAELSAGWRYLLGHRPLRRLFVNSVLVNGLIMAGEAPLAVLMLGQLGFHPWQYGLAFAVPCAGGLVGSRLARPLAARYGTDRMLRVFGVLRCCWPLGLVLVRPGMLGLIVVIAVELVLICCCSIFGPISASYRLRAADSARVTRMLAAWSVGSTTTRAVLVAAWGVLATVTSPRWALAAAGLLLLTVPLLFPVGEPAEATASTEPAPATTV